MKNFWVHFAFVMSFLLSVTLFISSCGSDYSSGDEQNSNNPDDQVTYRRSFPTGRQGERVIDYVGKQELGRATTNADNVGSYSFTQDKYDELDADRANTSGKGISAQIVIDSTIVKNGNTVVARQGQQTIGSTSTEVNFTSSRDLWSHELQWFGNASPASFVLYANNDTIPTATAQSVDYSPSPTRVNITWLDNKNTAQVDSIRGTYSLAGIEFRDVVATGPIPVGEFLDYQGGAGEQGGFLFVQGGNGNGQTNVGIVPTIVGGDQVTNTTIVLDNIDTPGNQYTISESGPQAIFNSIVVEGDSDAYQVTISSNLGDDARFFQTIDTVEVVSNQDQQFQIEVDAVQNEQDITVVAYDFDNISQKVSNYTIELRQSVNDALIESKTTDGNGEATFEKVDGNQDVYVVGYGSGRYKKTNGDYAIPFVQTVGEADNALNVTSPKYFNYSDGQQVQAEIINWYRPTADNTEAALDQLSIFFPEAAERQVAIEQLSNAASLTNTSFSVDTSVFGFPSTSIIIGYNPFPGPDRQTYPGQVQTQVLGYTQTNTLTEGKVLPNGRRITFYTIDFTLGGGDESRNHHEYGNLLNFPTLNGNTTIFTGDFFVTSRDVNAAQNTTINESKWDSAIMPFWIQNQKHHYNTTDSEGRIIDYSIAERYDDN